MHIAKHCSGAALHVLLNSLGFERASKAQEVCATTRTGWFLQMQTKQLLILTVCIPELPETQGGKFVMCSTQVHAALACLGTASVKPTFCSESWCVPSAIWLLLVGLSPIEIALWIGVLQAGSMATQGMLLSRVTCAAVQQ